MKHKEIPDINITMRKDQKILIDTTLLDVLEDGKYIVLSPKDMHEVYKDES